MKKIILGLLLIFGSIVMVGCSSGQNIELKQVKKIRKGRTTEQQVRQMFGEPTSTNLDYKRGRKTLIYGYVNSDGSKKALAGAAGTAAGMVLGPVGWIAGAVAGNSVQNRSENKTLSVIISTRTHRVIDYNYRVTQGRTSSAGMGSSIGGI